MRLNITKTSMRRPRLLIRLSYFCFLYWIFFSTSLTHHASMVNGEFYSSVDSLKILGNMEAALIQNYREYLKLQKQDMNIVQRFLKDVKFHHELAKGDVSDYIENPINAFTLIKRMVNDWKDLFEFLKFQDVKIDAQESLTQFQKDFQLPDENELKGAIRGLKRLQSIYKINAQQMALGGKYGNTLTWRDCLEIGGTLFDDFNFHQAVEWLELSLLQLQESKESSDIKDFYTNHIKEYLALCYQSIGEPEIAIEQLEDILAKDRDNNARITKNLLLNEESETPEIYDPSTEYPSGYSRLCRGERQLNAPKLSCKLDAKRHPYFILNPLQIEPLLLRPPVTLYHNLLNDAQIAQLSKETENKFERSKVVNGSGSIILENRVSQQTWLDPAEITVVGKIYKLVNLITGFDMSNAELMQLANYGIGGQYDPHYDYFDDDYETKYIGNRIATNMFYLSDVEEGGYTVFPLLDVYSKPVKGAMVMWYNLHKSSDKDERTLHAGCPVLKGSKKIANIWTHEGYQELRRPCGLVNERN